VCKHAVRGGSCHYHHTLLAKLYACNQFICFHHTICLIPCDRYVITATLCRAQQVKRLIHEIELCCVPAQGLTTDIHSVSLQYNYSTSHTSLLCLSLQTYYSMSLTTKLLAMCRVDQNHIYTVYIRYFWQGNHQIYGVYIRFWPTLAMCSICASHAVISFEQHCDQAWPGPYMYTVYDRIFDDFPARNTVYTPYIYIYIYIYGSAYPDCDAVSLSKAKLCAGKLVCSLSCDALLFLGTKVPTMFSSSSSLRAGQLLTFMSCVIV